MNSAEIPRHQVTSDEVTERSLFEVRRTIYPRAVTGWFATWRIVMVWLTQVLYYCCCWLPWNGRQAVLFDIVGRRFYIFGLMFWPQDIFLLAVLLIICAYSLFLFTAVGGRLWCGYACPQTVYTEIFLWLEYKIEGDRSARMRLDQSPLSARKIGRKAAKHGAWLAIALWTGFTFVGYVTPIRSLAREVVSFSLGPWEAFWIFFYSLATYGNAGWMREQVCKYMCPYARFQGVMFDRDTLIVTYDAERGEPRGPRSKSVDPKSAGLGDCLDCNICVQVCPTGIDIRNGLQYECIGCSACIDGCNQVMGKMGYRKGLIRYATENALVHHWQWREILGHVLRPRVLVYSTLLVAICTAFVWGLDTKSPLRVDVIRDRGMLAREVGDDLVENVYQLRVMNVSEQDRRYAVSVSGIRGIDIDGEHIIEVPASSSRQFTVDVRAPEQEHRKRASPIFFDVRSIADENIRVHEKSVFLQP